MAHHESEDHSYHPQDALSVAMKATVLTGGLGFLGSTVQNTLARQNIGPWGVFWRSGSTITVLAAMGGTFSFVKTASANLREREDTFNTSIAGFFSGAILGLRARTFPAVLGYGAALSAFVTAFEYTGGTLFGYEKERHEDEYDHRTAMRKNFRSPGEQTIAELGEGRGIYGPGYEQRRAERIKEAYGIEVPTSPVPAS